METLPIYIEIYFKKKKENKELQKQREEERNPPPPLQDPRSRGRGHWQRPCSMAENIQAG